MENISNLSGKHAFFKVFGEIFHFPFSIFHFPFFLFAQGPLDGYLKGKGVLDLAPSISFNRASSFLGAQGQVFDAPYKGQLLSLFGEYGLSSNFDLVATGSMVFTKLRSGLQDGGLFVKYRPYYGEIGAAGKLAVLFGTGAAFPLADYEPTATGALGQKAVFVPARLILQWETPLGLFLNTTLGYSWRLDDLREEDIALIRKRRPGYDPQPPPDYSTLLFKVGLPASKYYLDAWYERQYTRGGADYMPNVPDLPQAYGVNYQQIGGTAFANYSAHTGYFISGAYTLKGRNSSKISRISLGLVYKLGKKT